MDRIDLYLQQGLDAVAYQNTDAEKKRLDKFVSMYTMANSAKQSNPLSSNENIQMWRRSYYGTLGALNKDGGVSNRKMKTLRKMVYEFVESKIDNNIPLPRMQPKHATERPLVEVTEDYLKYEIDNMYGKYLNDRSERATYVDGISWYKICWDSMDSGHTYNGKVKIEVKLADQVIPQPGISDWRKLQYLFEIEQMSVSTIYDLFGRIVTPTGSNTSVPSAELKGDRDMSTVTVITCYYLNEHNIVGRFMWCKDTRQVICDDKDWQIRKLRTCRKCGHVQGLGNVCSVCGSESWKYENATEEVLEDDLYVVRNPYKEGDSNNPSDDVNQLELFLTKGTKIPFYQVRMLPFVPRPAVSSIESLYGIGEPYITMQGQDSINKMLTKMEDKTLKSGAVLTKPDRRKVNDTDASFKIVDVKTAEEAAMIQVKQIMADTSQDILSSNLLYDTAKATSGITDSFQGQRDTTATSGKAKEFAAMQTAGRIESLRVMKAAAFAGVYELVLKYLLAFSDEPRQFVKILPNGQETTEEWNKYMFLSKTKDGTVYYRDDFNFSTDPAATLATNRVAMWQETTDKFINGMLGNPAESRVLELYWNLMEQQQYPLAKLVLAGIKDNAQHLPAEIEQMLVQNPEILQATMQMMQQQQVNALGDEATSTGSGSGGARVNSGPEGNGATHAANVERTNARNASQNRQVTGAVQGGVGGNKTNAQAGGTM